MFISRKLTDEEIILITQQPYISSAELGRKYGLKPSTVRNYRRRHGIDLSNRFKPDINEFIQKAEELNKNANALAKYYNRSHQTILSYADSIGYNIRQKKLTKEQEQEIVEKYYNYSASAIAEEYGVSKDCIGAVWHRYNLKGKIKRVYPILNENAFKNIDNESAYLLGFIGSDGCLYKYPENDGRQDILSITIHKQDIKILELFKNKLKTDKPITERDDYVSLQISSNIISEDIRKLNVSYNKTYGNTIADIPTDFMPALIRGYIDGDGSIYYSNDKLTISIAGYKNNMIKIKHFLETNNIFTNFIVDHRKYQHDENNPFGQLITINKTQTYSLLKLIYTNCGNYYMDRKKEIADSYINIIENSEYIRDKQIVLYYNYAVCKKSG